MVTGNKTQMNMHYKIKKRMRIQGLKMIEVILFIRPTF